jgi:hypothetical protein
METAAMCVWITFTQATSRIRHKLAVLLLISAGWCCPALPSRAGETSGLIEFTNAVLFTPARTNMQDRLFAFAPLMVIETAATDLAGLPASDQFGALEKTGGRVAVNPKRPTVYGRREVVALRGRPYERYSYVWWHPTLELATPIASQGLRITVTPAGQSIAFEILGDATNAGAVVVSQAMEAAAMLEFRGPLPGRRFAIERAVGTPFAATVDRVIEDGPLELGPAVYLRANGRGVSTVICRCMPAQTRVIAATGYFDLVEWNDAVARLEAEVRRQHGIKPLWWLAQPDIESGLERFLRLPQHFPSTPAMP